MECPHGKEILSEFRVFLIFHLDTEIQWMPRTTMPPLPPVSAHQGLPLAQSGKYDKNITGSMCTLRALTYDPRQLKIVKSIPWFYAALANSTKLEGTIHKRVHNSYMYVKVSWGQLDWFPQSRCTDNYIVRFMLEYIFRWGTACLIKKKNNSERVLS